MRETLFKMEFDYDSIIKILKKLESYKIAIVGPQRTGSKFISEVMAEDLGFKNIAESDFYVHNFDKFIEIIAKNESQVIHCPSLSNCILRFHKGIIVIWPKIKLHRALFIGFTIIRNTNFGCEEFKKFIMFF